MTCRTDACTQGRQPCPTPWHCGHGLRRVEPSALQQKDGGMSVDFAGHEPEDDMSPTAKAIVQCFCIAVALVALCTVAANAIF